MNKTTLKVHSLFLLIFSLTNLNSADINYQLLEPRVGNFSSRILSGEAITADSIREHLDFIPSHCISRKCESAQFSRLITATLSTIKKAREKLGHNRFNTFVNDCKTIFENDKSEDKEKFALFVLLSSVQSKVDYFIEDIETDVEEESRIPDEQFSFLFDSDQDRSRSSSVRSAASTQHISSSESASEDSDHGPTTRAELDDITFASVSLDGRALQPSSFVYYQKKLPSDQSPICITCNLQSVTIDKMDALKEAIQKIDETKKIREILFTNGSSRKFNLLFDFLRDLSEKRTAETPITIVYSTTSESQKAYNKLSTLRGIVHNTPDVRGLTDPTRMKRDSMHTCQRVMSDFSDDSLEVIDSILGIKHRPENPI